MTSPRASRAKPGHHDIAMREDHVGNARSQRRGDGHGEDQRGQRQLRDR
jgi:hypothetical protein